MPLIEGKANVHSSRSRMVSIFNEISTLLLKIMSFTLTPSPYIVFAMHRQARYQFLHLGEVTREAHLCLHLAKGCYPGNNWAVWDSNPEPSNHKSH